MKTFLQFLLFRIYENQVKPLYFFHNILLKVYVSVLHKFYLIVPNFMNPNVQPFGLIFQEEKRQSREPEERCNPILKLCLKCRQMSYLHPRRDYVGLFPTYHKNKRNRFQNRLYSFLVFLSGAGFHCGRNKQSGSLLSATKAIYYNVSLLFLFYRSYIITIFL